MESRDIATNQIQIQKDRKEVVYHEVGEMIIIIPLLQSPKIYFRIKMQQSVLINQSVYLLPIVPNSIIQ